tara:strand:+ start:57955 stop:58302 length:348 start_codon:yes stop_codon:yes gene_type:complete
MVQARDHLIYSIEQEVPMGYDNEELKKNYFVNIGSNQGVEKGTRLDVYRIISKLNPYDNQKRINHKVKVGEMRVLYATDEASIGAMSKYYDDDNTPLFELEDFMIGDHVGISVTD